LEARRIDEVRIQTSDQLVAMPWATSQQLRGRLLAAGLDELEERFAARGTSAPVLLDEVDKEPLLEVVVAWIDEVGDGEAIALGGLPGLRDALRAEVAKP
jgi:hypothetical protein